MVYYLALFLIIWAMIFTAARFVKYYRISAEYKDQTCVKVISINRHEPTSKEEKKHPLVDIAVLCHINGEDEMTEFSVPAEAAGQFTIDQELSVSYKVSGNGAIHIASNHDAVKKMAVGYGIAVAVELAAFIAIWITIL